MASRLQSFIDDLLNCTDIVDKPSACAAQKAGRNSQRARLLQLGQKTLPLSAPARTMVSLLCWRRRWQRTGFLYRWTDNLDFLQAVEDFAKAAKVPRSVASGGSEPWSAD